jgi:hypothetical protein
MRFAHFGLAALLSGGAVAAAVPAPAPAPVADAPSVVTVYEYVCPTDAPDASNGFTSGGSSGSSSSGSSGSSSGSASGGTPVYNVVGGGYSPLPGQPETVLTPGLHPDHDAYDINHLRPGDSSSFFFNENQTGKGMHSLVPVLTLPALHPRRASCVTTY